MENGSSDEVTPARHDAVVFVQPSVLAKLSLPLSFVSAGAGQTDLGLHSGNVEKNRRPPGESGVPHEMVL